ncbi:MAG: GNAT family N-acetyltransferase [Desulfobacterales bacterium]|nr:GNAT family N-acetyltransferase [Desulfobacterales bacterium]
MDYKAWLEDYCPEKIVDASTAISKIYRGSRVFLGTGCGEPQHLIRTMANDPQMQDIMVYQMLPHTLVEFVENPDFLRRFSLKLFFVSPGMRKAAFEGKIDYIPTYLSQIPRLFKSQRIGLDVAIVQVSPPDRFGYCSLGVSVDITRSGVDHANVVVAQVNPRMPRTWGDGIIHVEDIDYLVIHDEPLIEYSPRVKDKEVVRRIGLSVARIIEDGDTLHIGFGELPNAILQYLDKKKALGVHTHVISDGLINLIEKDIITNDEKNVTPGRVMASMCMGSKEMYDYIDGNPIFGFRSAEFVNDPSQIARNDNMVSISTALEIDLTGQVCSDSLGKMFFSGIGDQVDFLRGCSMSSGGYSIVVLPSTAKNDTISRIVPHLSEGAGVANTRGDVNYVVTEYGYAELQGKSIYQRVMELAQVAHPKFRDYLIEEAKKHRYIFADQLPPSNQDLFFIKKYHYTMELDKGRTIEFRALYPSDEFEYRNFFYSLQEKTIFYRFFYTMKNFSHEVVQKQWADVDYRKNMSIIGLAQKGGHKEIMAIASYAMGENDRAEVAFVVREDFQGLGIASYMLKILEEIAKENNFKGFSATTLKDNTSMIHVFKKAYPNAHIVPRRGGDVLITMDFDEKPVVADNSPEENK